MNSLSGIELDTTYILNPLLKELDMIYELDDDPTLEEVQLAMKWYGVEYENLHIEEVMDKLIIKLVESDPSGLIRLNLISVKNHIIRVREWCNENDNSYD
jgi:hypothetical protein